MQNLNEVYTSALFSAGTDLKTEISNGSNLTENHLLISTFSRCKFCLVGYLDSGKSLAIQQLVVPSVKIQRTA